MRPRLVAITGPARSGKGTVFRLVRELRPDLLVVRDGFSDRLKISAARALGFEGSGTFAFAFGDALKHEAELVVRRPGGEYTISGRTFLQLYGTEAHRDVFGEDFWIRQVLPEPGLPDFGRGEPFDVLVVDDLRFLNEAERVKACGGVVWRVNRDVAIPESAHASEAGLPDGLVDVDLDNSGSLGDLRGEVARALAQLV